MSPALRLLATTALLVCVLVLCNAEPRPPRQFNFMNPYHPHFPYHPGFPYYPAFPYHRGFPYHPGFGGMFGMGMLRQGAILPPVLHPASIFFSPSLTQAGTCSFEKPFLCWGTRYCVSLAAVCDGIYDCLNGFEEHRQMCITAKRPSMVTIMQFLEANNWVVETLFNNVDKNYIAAALRVVNGVQELSYWLALPTDKVENIKKIFKAAQKDDDTRGSEMREVKDGLTDSQVESMGTFAKSLLDSQFSLA